MSIADRARDRLGRIKADRATKNGIAGHQAAMKALDPTPPLPEGVIARIHYGYAPPPPGAGHVGLKYQDPRSERWYRGEFSKAGIDRKNFPTVNDKE